jgi:hypothetical protein
MPQWPKASRPVRVVSSLSQNILMWQEKAPKLVVRDYQDNTVAALYWHSLLLDTRANAGSRKDAKE